MCKDEINFFEDKDVQEGVLTVRGADEMIFSNLDQIKKKSEEDDMEDVDDAEKMNSDDEDGL